jgi:hypothetical protein
LSRQEEAAGIGFGDPKKYSGVLSLSLWSSLSVSSRVDQSLTLWSSAAAFSFQELVVCVSFTLDLERKGNYQDNKKKNFDDGNWIGTSLLLSFEKGKTHIQVTATFSHKYTPPGYLQTHSLSNTMFWMEYSRTQILWNLSLGLYCCLQYSALQKGQ